MGQTKKDKTDTPEIKEQFQGDAAGHGAQFFPPESGGKVADPTHDPFSPTEVALPPQMTEGGVKQIVHAMGFVSKDAMSRMIGAAVDARILSLNLDATLAPLQALLEDAQKQQEKPEGIHAVLVASMFNCPKCNMRLDGPSGTSVQGKGVDYSHPFGESPKLNGGRCEYQGRKFKTPTIFLELQPIPQPKAQPLTDITQ